jgi:hypothetical protein
MVVCYNEVLNWWWFIGEEIMGVLLVITFLGLLMGTLVWLYIGNKLNSTCIEVDRVGDSMYRVVKKRYESGLVTYEGQHAAYHRGYPMWKPCTRSYCTQEEAANEVASCGVSG